MTDAPTIGVVGSADVASALRSIGFQVVTGSDFRQTATEISELLKNGRDFPVVVADSANTTALGAWTIKASELTHLVVLGTKPGIALLSGSPLRLELPATVNDLLGRLRYQVTPRPVGSQVINLDGSVGEPAAEVPKELPAPLPLPDLGGEELVERTPVGIPMERVDEPASDTSTGLTQGFPDDLFLTAGTAASGRPGVPTDTSLVTADAAPGPTPERAPLVLPPLAQRAVQDPATEEPESELPASAYSATTLPAASVEPVLVAAAAPSEHTQPARVPPAPQLQVDPSSDRDAASVPPQAAWEARRDQMPVEPAMPAPSVVGDDDVDFFARRAQRSQAESSIRHSSARPAGTRAEFVVTAAGRGGVGKSITAILLGQIAAEKGLRAVVIDGNRGQADLRKYLRLGTAPLRSAYDAALSGNPADAVLTPPDYAPYRLANRLDVPDFAIVLGPPSDHSGPDDVSAEVYRSIIDHCRTIADIVIVDTQIMESHRTDLWDRFIIPALRDDAWLVGITDESTPGVSNLSDRLKELQQLGVTNARTMVLATMYRNFSDEDAAYIQHKFGQYGSLVGSTGEDQKFHEDINLGLIYSQSPEITPAMNAILRQVTGRTDLFAPPEPVRKRRGLFSFRAGRR